MRNISRLAHFSPIDVIEYAKQIGINPEKEHDLLWIARKGLLANLPVEWLPVEDDQSRIYYYNKDSEASSWEHPADSTYRSLAESERSKRGRLNQSGFSASSTSVSMSGLTSLANLHFVDDDELSFNNDFNEITNGKGNDGKDKEGESKSRRRLESSNGGSLHNRVTVNPVENELLAKEEEEADVESVDFELELEEAVEELSFTDDIDGTGDQDGYEEERSKKAADAAKAIVASNGEEEEEEEEPEHDDDGDQLTFDITDEEERERKPLSEIFVVRLSEPEKEGRGKDEATMSSVLRTVQSKEGQIDEPRKVAEKVADSGQKLTPESGQRDGNAANLTIIDTEWKSKQISVESANMSIGSTEGQERERRRREKGEKSASSSKAMVTTGLPFHSNDDQSNLGQNEEDPFAESNLSVREETTNNNVSVERKKSGRLVREAAKGKEGEEDDYDEKHEQDGDFYGRGKATETDRKSFSESLVGLAAQRKEETMKTEKERDINISNRISERLEYDNDEDADDDAKEEEDAHGAGKGKCKQHTDETELDNASRQSLYSESRFSNPVDRMVNRESRNIVAQSVNYSLNEVDVQTKFDAISEQLRTQMDQIRNEIRDQMSTESTKANRSIMSKIEGLQEQIQSLRDTVDSMDSRKEQELISLETRLLRTMSRTDDRGQVHVNKKTLDDLETKFSRSQSDLGESLQQSMKTLRDQVSKQFYERLREVQQETSLKFDDFKYENSVNWSTTKKELSALNSSNRLLVDRNDKFDNDLTKYLSELDKVKADQRACVLRTDSRFEEQRDTLVLELDKVRSTLKKELHAVRDSVNDRLHQCLEKCEMSSKESQSAVDRAGVQLNRLKIEQQALREMADTMVEKEQENDLKILKVKQDVAELKTGLLETGKEKPDTETVPGQTVVDREAGTKGDRDGGKRQEHLHCS
ncbi:Centrosomal protein [Halotydeus destructor]|nr:Centrosomal protein [Halotydeus destructor]